MDSEETELRVGEDDSNDGDFVATGSRDNSQKSKLQVAKKPREQKKPKVTIEWSDDEIFQLIKAVEERPCLWNKGLAEYNRSKVKAWEEVVSDMKRPDMKKRDCKALWSNLSKSFMAKHRTQKSNQSTDESCTSTWKFFESMLFLAVMDQPSTSGQRSRRRVTSSQGPMSTPSLLPMQSPRSDTQLLEEVAAKAIASMTASTVDEYTAFATHVAAELRSLPTREQAILAKRKLARALVDVMDEVLLMVSACSIHSFSQFHSFLNIFFFFIFFDLAPPASPSKPDTTSRLDEDGNDITSRVIVMSPKSDVSREAGVSQLASCYIISLKLPP